MQAEGVESVTVLPTHLIPGIEAEKVRGEAEAVRERFRRLDVACVLLQTEEDYVPAARALWNGLKTDACGRTVVLMGHGTSHEADESYGKLEQALRDYSGAPVYLATVEGQRTIETVLAQLRKDDPAREKKVLLTTCMLVAGEHAEQDMAGEKDSFRTKLQAAGYETECLLKGIGEYEEIRKRYLEHLRQAEENGENG